MSRSRVLDALARSMRRALYCEKHNIPTAEQIDRTSLREYLETRGAGPNIKAAIEVAYTGEYGCQIDQQSALNLLFLIHADKRSKFAPFGVFSDERFHLVNGDEQIAQGIASRLPGPIELGVPLVRAGKTPGGRVDLTFQRDKGRPITRTHDAVVLGC